MSEMVLDMSSPQGTDAFKAYLLAVDAMQTHLKRSAPESIRSMALETLKSMRAMTKIAKLSGSYAKVRKSDYEPSFRREGGKIFRTVRQKGGHHIDNWLSTATVRNASSHDWWNGGLQVFYITFPQNKKMMPKFLVCQNAKDATAWIKSEKPAHHPLIRHKGLAKRVWSVTRGKLGAGLSNDSANGSTKVLASRLADVKLTDSGATISVWDNSNYAVNALKGGEGAIAMAIMKAARKKMAYIGQDMDELIKKVHLDGRGNFFVNTPKGKAYFGRYANQDISEYLKEAL